MLSLAFSPATADDARFVARHVLEALHWHMYDEPLNAEQRQAWDELTTVCRRDDVLYSSKHALLAKIGGEPVGLILAYDGANYHPLRTRTFALLPAFAGMDVESMEDEAVAGEYYIDSLAVAPTQRGKGVGAALLAQAVAHAAQLGLRPSLLVDPDNPFQPFRKAGLPINQVTVVGAVVLPLLAAGYALEARRLRRAGAPTPVTTPPQPEGARR